MAEAGAVWQLVVRADELMKYARNRDPKDAYAQARAVLGEASAAAAGLDDARAAESLGAQIARRLEDLERLERESA